MKKLLISLLAITASFGFLYSSAYNPTNADQAIADILFEKILEVSEKQNNPEIFAQSIKTLITDLQEHPKSDERTKEIFTLIIDEINSHFFPEEFEQPYTPVREFTTQEEMLSTVNTERNKAGKADLALNDLLNTAAQKHAQYMSDTQDFNHTTEAGLRFDERISNEGYLYNFAGENIAYGQDTVTIVMETRMNSPGHKANIIDENFTELGVGYTGIYRVQVFAKPQ